MMLFLWFGALLGQKTTRYWEPTKRCVRKTVCEFLFMLPVHHLSVSIRLSQRFKLRPVDVDMDVGHVWPTSNLKGSVFLAVLILQYDGICLTLLSW